MEEKKETLSRQTLTDVIFFESEKAADEREPAAPAEPPAQTLARQTLTDVIFFELQEDFASDGPREESDANGGESDANASETDANASETAAASTADATATAPANLTVDLPAPQPFIKRIAPVARSTFTARPRELPPAPQARASRATRPSAGSTPSGATRLRARDSRTVSILICATADKIELGRKLENTLSVCGRSQYKIEVLVGCEDDNAEALRLLDAYLEFGVRVVTWRKGVQPLPAWSQLAQAAQGDLVLFSDVESRMAPDTLDLLLAPMRDRQVGMTVPRYVPCVDEGQGLRARLEAATHGVGAACYAGMAVRRHLLHRPAHDTVQPGLVAALHVLGRGFRVTAVPEVRVFHREINSPAARFARIARRTQGQLQAALRQRRAMRAERRRLLLSVLIDGLRYVPALAAWLGSALVLALFGFVVVALSMLGAGALSIVSANLKPLRRRGLHWFHRIGTALTNGAAQTYGILRLSR